MPSVQSSDYVLLLILVLCSAFFSAAEAAFMSINRIRLKNMAASGNKKAQRVLGLIRNEDQLLTAFLIGNNIANTAASSMGAVICTTLFGASGVALSTLFITIIILVVSEVTPKSVARQNALPFMRMSVDVLGFFYYLFYPISYCLNLLSRLISRSDAERTPSVTEEELRVIIDEIEDEGVIKEYEGELLEAVLEFDDITAGSIITPRVDIVGIEMGASDEEIVERFYESQYSRLPVYEETLDNIQGVLYEHDFLLNLLRREGRSVREMMRGTLYVPKTKNVSELLKELQRGQIHLAVVTDQYGGTIGIVTLEDIIEELVGEIYDEFDEIHQAIQPEGDNRFVINPDLDAEDFFEYFSLAEDVGELQSRTIGGYVMEKLGRIPDCGDTLDIEGLVLTVSQKDDNRITEFIAQLPRGREKKQGTGEE